jgi:hypothetical protein
MTKTVKVIDELLECAPLLRPVYQEHLAEYDELLPHVLFGDLTRFVANLCMTDSSSAELKSILAVLENGLACGDEYTQELISVSFLENLERDASYYPLLTGMFGEALAKELQNYR